MNSDSRKVLIIVENLPVPFDTRVWQEATTLAMNGYSYLPEGKGIYTGRGLPSGCACFQA